MRKDTLAAGARSAKFAGGVGEGAGPSIMSEEDRALADAATQNIVIEKKAEPRKKFYPLENVMLVRRMEAATVSDILITETIEKEKPAEGFIVERGPNVPISLTVGTHVVFGKYSGTEFKLNGEIFLLMKTDELLGTIGDEPTNEQPEVEIEITPGTQVATA
jgi:chaperonin GroES